MKIFLHTNLLFHLLDQKKGCLNLNIDTNE